MVYCRNLCLKAHSVPYQKTSRAISLAITLSRPDKHLHSFGDIPPKRHWLAAVSPCLPTTQLHRHTGDLATFCCASGMSSWVSQWARTGATMSGCYDIHTESMCLSSMQIYSTARMIFLCIPLTTI